MQMFAGRPLRVDVATGRRGELSCPRPAALFCAEIGVASIGDVTRTRETIPKDQM